jgi:hypothetical protein
MERINLAKKKGTSACECCNESSVSIDYWETVDNVRYLLTSLEGICYRKVAR